MHTFPVLYGKDKKGGTKVWKATVAKLDDGRAAATIEFGALNGNLQTTVRVYDKGKNIGKINETTAFEQAISETQSKWNDKKNKESYSLTQESDEVLNTVYFPMLAHTYNPELTSTKQKIAFPCYVQPKLDGVRCICYRSNKDGEVVMQSRTGAAFSSLGHLRDTLSSIFLTKDVVLDGELYTDEMPFEELVGLIKTKKLTPEILGKIAKIKYHVYDVICPDIPFKERTQIVHDLLIRSSPVVSVATDSVTDVAGFRLRFAEYVQQGYEGIMLRNGEGKYQCNYRSHDLQKYKEFLEEEYRIVAYGEGAGKDQGTVIWTCETANGTQFNVRPRGTAEMRRQWFETGDRWVGSLLTVVFQELSDHGVPRFPVGKSLREGY